MAEGRFNMLKAGVDFLLERQEGRGACAVSEYYAFECHARYLSCSQPFWTVYIVYVVSTGGKVL